MKKSLIILCTLIISSQCFSKDGLLSYCSEKKSKRTISPTIGTNQIDSVVIPTPVTPSKALIAYTQKALKEKDSEIPDEEIGKIHVFAYSWAFLKPGYVMFVSVFERERTFANDRGYMNNSSYYRGLWSEKKGRMLKPSEYGRAFSRFDLNVEEAISFWKTHSGESSYETEVKKAIFDGPGAKPPKYNKGVLTICSYQYTGMRGNVYNYYEVKFPRKRKDFFKLSKY